MAIFTITASYMVIVNRCKFNKRTKVVLVVLSFSMMLQTCSSVMTYVNTFDKDACGVYPLAYTMLS